MPLIRGHHEFDDQYTQIPNEWLRDKRLSLATRGLLAQIMSHRPGWSITLENLAFANDIGRDAIRTCINQLLEVGYLVRSEQRERNSKGQVAGYVYTTQTPPTQDEPTLDLPTQGKLPLKKNIDLEQQVIEQQVKKYPQILEDEFDEFWKLYPRKVGKAEARRAYAKAVGSHGSLDVMSGVMRLASDPNLPETRYIPHPATWLNRGGWDDEPYPAKQSNAQAKEQRQEQAAKRFLEAFNQPTKQLTSDIDWNVL